VRKLSPNVYVNIDVDGFDLSDGGGMPEPGGLFWDEVIELLTTLAAGHRIVGFDIVELALTMDQWLARFWRRGWRSG
jgi:agmatinase